jgi:hypothetical protein
MLVNASVGDNPCPPEGATTCEPTIVEASQTVFHLVNPKKEQNYIYGEVDVSGVLDFLVYNLPADHTGCPGRWMFQQMLAHFQRIPTTITAIAGNWSGQSTNLVKVNTLTAGNAMTLEDAAKLTNTGQYATLDAGYTNVTILYPDPSQPGSIGTRGTPGNYTSVHVRFTK